jgi:predicted ATPase
MARVAHRDARTIALDPGLLATPFDDATNWYVITGAPSCGKTTLIDLLSAEGLRIVPECARQIIEEEMSTGHSIAEIHEQARALQQRVLREQLRVEAALQPADTLFLDSATPSSLAWYRCFGLDPNEALPYCFGYRYASVFVLEPLPLRRDGIRFEDDTIASFLDAWIMHDYASLGYSVVRVPLMAPRERLSYVLERVFPA